MDKHLYSFTPDLRDSKSLIGNLMGSDSENLFNNKINSLKDKFEDENFFTKISSLKSEDLFESIDLFNYLINESVNAGDFNNLELVQVIKVRNTLFRKQYIYKNKNVKFNGKKIELEVIEEKGPGYKDQLFYKSMMDTLIGRFNYYEKNIKTIIKNFDDLLLMDNSKYKSKDFDIGIFEIFIWEKNNTLYFLPALTLFTKPSKLESQKYCMIGLKKDLSVFWLT